MSAAGTAEFDNEFQQRARARKAFRLSRLIAAAVRDSAELETPITVDDMRAAPEKVRTRVAAVANVRRPSDLSWEMACDLAVETLR